MVLCEPSFQHRELLARQESLRGLSCSVAYFVKPGLPSFVIPIGVIDFSQVSWSPRAGVFRNGLLLDLSRVVICFVEYIFRGDFGIPERLLSGITAWQVNK